MSNLAAESLYQEFQSTNYLYNMERTRTVKLREKILADGRKSLYLDYYPAVYNPETGKETRREFLKIYLHDKPANPAQKEYNRISKAKAESIRSEREIQFINQNFDFADGSLLKRIFSLISKKRRLNEINQRVIMITGMEPINTCVSTRRTIVLSARLMKSSVKDLKPICVQSNPGNPSIPALLIIRYIATTINFGHVLMKRLKIDYLQLTRFLELKVFRWENLKGNF